MYHVKGSYSEREKELLSNGKRSLVDCLVNVGEGKFDESLRILLIGIDIFANLKARVSGQTTTEKEAERGNRKRFIAFLRNEIPGWTEHEMHWEGKTILLDLSEMSYEIRCKQIHEYSNLNSAEFPVRLRWDQLLHSGHLMWIYGCPTSKVIDHVELNGFRLLQRLVEVAQKYVGIFSSTATHVCGSINSYAIYELLGTVKTGKPLDEFGRH